MMRSHASIDGCKPLHSSVTLRGFFVIRQRHCRRPDPLTFLALVQQTQKLLATGAALVKHMRNKDLLQ